MARPQYEKSPRQRTEWFGSLAEVTLNTSTVDGTQTNASVVVTSRPRLTPSTGTIFPVAFPAGIVRGETCSIARFIAHVCFYDTTRRQQNVSYELAAGLIKQEVEDDVVADPTNTGALVQAPDPLEDLRAAWLWHDQTIWSPQSAGANYTVLQWEPKLDSTNSRIFESNDVLSFAVQARPRVNSGSAVALPLRCTLMWRALLRLD